MYITSVGTAFPEYKYPQSVITETLQERMKDLPDTARVMGRLHSNCGVDSRHLMYPLEDLGKYRGFKATNDLWIKGAVELGRKAIEQALSDVGLEPRDISAIFFTSVTGIACPSIEARLIDLMGFRPNTKRIPMFGLGCVAGAAGVSRVTDYLKAYPEQCALLLSVELCTLTWQEHDHSMAHLIACGLFGDGAAAVVMAGERKQLAGTTGGRMPRIVDTLSTLYPNTQHLMGWNIDENGFNVVLSGEVPQVVQDNLRDNVDQLLSLHGLKVSDITSWVFHSGGPKVLQAVQSCLGLADNALQASYNSLSKYGNLSSASVLTVLKHFMASDPGKPGSYSVMGAMGPAFCSELLLLQW